MEATNKGEQVMSRQVSRAVKRAQEGDREALGFLYARYADNVCGYVRSIVHDQHEAEDVTQHVFAKLIHVIGKYEERDVPFFAWILRVARNVAVDHIRRQRLIPVEEVRTSDEGSGDPSGGGRMNDLRDALSTLPQAQREVLVLRHFAGLSPTEIATRMGRSRHTLGSPRGRGRASRGVRIGTPGDLSRDPSAVEVREVVEDSEGDELLHRHSQAGGLLVDRLAGEAVELQRQAALLAGALKVLRMAALRGRSAHDRTQWNRGTLSFNGR